MRTQLAAQKIVFPAKGSAELKALPAAGRTEMSQYAGQRLTTGAQAEVWADHFIAVHLREIGGGKTYSQLSGEYLAMTPAQQASAKGVALNGQVQLARPLLTDNHSPVRARAPRGTKVPPSRARCPCAGFAGGRQSVGDGARQRGAG